ncbi:Retrovirus-related Pol polyprotein from transposon TNT 1-94 [Formica fusca]
MGLTDAAVYLTNFLKELGFEGLIDITLYNDNQGAGELARNPVYHARSKHIEIRQHFIREVLYNYSIKLKYLPTEKMLADILTKELPKMKHNYCVRGLGLNRME